VSTDDLLAARVRAFQAALGAGGKLPALAPAKATRPPLDALAARARAVEDRLAEAYAKRRLARPHLMSSGSPEDQRGSGADLFADILEECALVVEAAGERSIPCGRSEFGHQGCLRTLSWPLRYAGQRQIFSPFLTFAQDFWYNHLRLVKPFVGPKRGRAP
jgi:hypothetical protein